MSNEEKKHGDNHEGEAGWGGTGFGGSGYGSHQGFGPAVYGAPADANLDELDPPLADIVVHDDVIAALVGQSGGDEIQVSICNGEVTLTGAVESEETRRNLEQVVYAVRGVGKVHNLISVDKARGERPWDEEETIS